MDEILNTHIKVGHVMFASLLLGIIWAMLKLYRTEIKSSKPEVLRPRMTDPELDTFSQFVLRNLQGEALLHKALFEVEQHIGQAMERTKTDYELLMSRPVPKMGRREIDEVIDHVLNELAREGKIPKRLLTLRE